MKGKGEYYICLFKGVWGGVKVWKIVLGICKSVEYKKLVMIIKIGMQWMRCHQWKNGCMIGAGLQQMNIFG